VGGGRGRRQADDLVAAPGQQRAEEPADRARAEDGDAPGR
jgi:hypothetical protein